MKKKIVIKSFFIVALAAVSVVVFNGFTNFNNKAPEDNVKDFLEGYEVQMQKLEKANNLAYFNASISGKEEDYEKLEVAKIALNNFYANKENFNEISSYKKSGEVADEILKRQLDVIYNKCLQRQVAPLMLKELVSLENQIEKSFSTFRPDINDKKVSDNQIEKILKTSTNSEELEEAWKASKDIGDYVASDLLKLVILRNKIAVNLGYENYFKMQLSLNEQDPIEIERIFHNLNESTNEIYINLKEEIDVFLEKRNNIPKEDIMPWHYQNRFFQEAPDIYKVNLDKYYTKKDLVKITSKYYTSIGLNITDIIKNSDLFEKPAKNQHAYCINIDREGDVRVLCNLKSNYNWMNTILHEFGHAVYEKNINKELPYSLREPAHAFTTEAVAMMFGRMAADPKWMKNIVGISDVEIKKIASNLEKKLRLEQIVFCRWSMVMYWFEKAMYENPEQDLNELWWQLVEEYQMIKRPLDRNAPDWATKIHIATFPCYYHNYMLGEIYASQLYNAINREIYEDENSVKKVFANNEKIGMFLIEKVFAHGKKLDWENLVRESTGEELNPEYFIEQFINSNTDQ